MLKHNLIRPDSDEPPAEIHKRLSSGDQAAFKSFFEHYQPKLFSYILKIVKSKEIAEELVTDIFVKIWSAKEIMNDVENADAFLYRMSVNKALDFLKTASREKKLQLLLHEYIQYQSSTHSIELETREFESQLNQCMLMLSNQQQLIIKLSREDGLTHNQIAEQLNLSRNTVKNHITNALKTLKRVLQYRQGICTIPLILLNLLLR